jgi:hypothetical protein
MVVSLKASFVLVLISSVTLSLTYISILIPFLTRLDFCPVLSIRSYRLCGESVDGLGDRPKVSTNLLAEITAHICDRLTIQEKENSK